MAYDFGTKQANELTETELGLLRDLSKIGDGLRGHCFAGLNFWRRAATTVAIAVAAKAVSGAVPNIELGEHGWSLQEDGAHCVTSEQQTAVEASAVESTDPAVELSKLIERSYERDYASYQARVAVRRRGPEARDDFAETATDDDDEYYPELVAFRQRSTFTLQGV